MNVPIPESAREPLQLLDDAKEALHRVHECGVRVAASSRFELHLRAIEWAANRDEVDGAGCMALLDFHQLEAIMREFRGSKDPAFLNALKKMMGDGVVPLPQGKTTGRDFQSELWWASVFRRRMFAVEFSEPDVIVNGAKFTAGIAAKRVKAVNGLRSALRTGFGQLRTWGDRSAYGFVGLDATLIANPKAEIAMVEDGSSSRRNFANEALDRVVPVIEANVKYALERRKNERLNCGVYVCVGKAAIDRGLGAVSTDFAFRALHAGGAGKEVVRYLNQPSL